MQTLTWSCVEATGIKELQSEMDVNITKKHQDVAFLPGVGSNIQTPTSGKLLVHWDQSIIGEALLPVTVLNSMTHYPQSWHMLVKTLFSVK